MEEPLTPFMAFCQQNPDRLGAFMKSITEIISRHHQGKAFQNITVSDILHNKPLLQCFSEVITVPVVMELNVAVHDNDDKQYQFSTDWQSLADKLKTDRNLDLNQGYLIGMDLFLIQNTFPCRVGINLGPAKETMGYLDIIAPGETKRYSLESGGLHAIPPARFQSQLETLHSGLAFFSDENLARHCIVVNKPEIGEPLVLVPKCSKLYTYVLDVVNETLSAVTIGSQDDKYDSEYVIVSKSLCDKTFAESSSYIRDKSFALNTLKVSNIPLTVTLLDQSKLSPGTVRIGGTCTFYVPLEAAQPDCFLLADTYKLLVDPEAPMDFYVQHIQENSTPVLIRPLGLEEEEEEEDAMVIY